MLSVYPAVFYKEENGYSVIFPDLNNLATCGDSLEDAMSMAVDCLAGYLYSAKLSHEEVEPSSELSDVDPISIAKELESDPGEYFVNFVSVDVDEYVKLHFSKSVKKTLSIPEWLNREALSKNINFSQVLQEALIEKLNL